MFRDYLPESVQKRISLFLLQKALGQFLENELNLENLDVQIGQGSVVLKDLSLNLIVLNDVCKHAGLRVLHGSVKQIIANIPWSDLWSGHCSLKLDGLTIEAIQVPLDKTHDLGKSISEHFMSTSIHFAGDFLKSSMLSDQEDLFPQTTTTTGSTLDGLKILSKLIERIMTTVGFSATDTVIRIRERDRLSQGVPQPTSIELCIPLISFEDDTPRNDLKAGEAVPTTVYEKKILIGGFGVYVNQPSNLSPTRSVLRVPLLKFDQTDPSIVRLKIPVDAFVKSNSANDPNSEDTCTAVIADLGKLVSCFTVEQLDWLQHFYKYWDVLEDDKSDSMMIDTPKSEEYEAFFDARDESLVPKRVLSLTVNLDEYSCTLLCQKPAVDSFDLVYAEVEKRRKESCQQQPGSQVLQALSDMPYLHLWTDRLSVTFLKTTLETNTSIHFESIGLSIGDFASKIHGIALQIMPSNQSPVSPEVYKQYLSHDMDQLPSLCLSRRCIVGGEQNALKIQNLHGLARVSITVVEVDADLLLANRCAEFIKDLGNDVQYQVTQSQQKVKKIQPTLSVTLDSAKIWVNLPSVTSEPPVGPNELVAHIFKSSFTIDTEIGHIASKSQCSSEAMAPGLRVSTGEKLDVSNTEAEPSSGDKDFGSSSWYDVGGQRTQSIQQWSDAENTEDNDIANSLSAEATDVIMKDMSENTEEYRDTAFMSLVLLSENCNYVASIHHTALNLRTDTHAASFLELNIHHWDITDMKHNIDVLRCLRNDIEDVLAISITSSYDSLLEMQESLITVHVKNTSVQFVPDIMEDVKRFLHGLPQLEYSENSDQLSRIKVIVSSVSFHLQASDKMSEAVLVLGKGTVSSDIIPDSPTILLQTHITNTRAFLFSTNHTIKSYELLSGTPIDEQLTGFGFAEIIACKHTDIRLRINQGLLLPKFSVDISNGECIIKTCPDTVQAMAQMAGSFEDKSNSSSGQKQNDKVSGQQHQVNQDVPVKVKIEENVFNQHIEQPLDSMKVSVDHFDDVQSLDETGAEADSYPAIEESKISDRSGLSADEEEVIVYEMGHGVALDIHDNHFSLLGTVENDERRLLDQTTSLYEFKVRRTSITWQIYDGLDFPERQSLNVSQRSAESRIDFCLLNVTVDFDEYPSGFNRSRRVYIAIQDVEIIDKVKTSLWRKFLSSLRPDSNTEPRESLSNMVRFEIVFLNTKENNDEEVRVKLRILPLRLHIDQDALTAIISFFSFTASEAETTPHVKKNNKPDDHIFFQLLEISPIVLKVDYKPKHVDYQKLNRGNVVEVVNFFPLEGAEMTLTPVRISGVKGLPKLVDAILQRWIPHITSSQVPRVVSGLSGVNTLVNVTTGLTNLVLLPIQQYRKDGRIIKGETIKVGTSLAAKAQNLLEKADVAVNEGSRHWRGEEHSKFSEQPKDLKEGVDMAYRTMSLNLGKAARTIFAVPMSVYEKSPKGTARAVVRAIPVAVLKPMIGATDAVSKTLIGLQNTIEPNRKLQMEDNEEPKKSSTWVDSRMDEYEIKIRSYSHPFKVFNYFASCRKGGEAYMTPYDLIRSLLPIRVDEANKHKVASSEEIFKLADTDGDGLISYAEYLIFITLLGTPIQSWKVSFNIFDENGDGSVSRKEFTKIMAHHLKTLSSGSKLGSAEVNQEKLRSSGIMSLFFGRKGDKPLYYEEFVDFMSRLHLEILKLEFNQYDVVDGTISLSDFGRTIVSHSTPKNMTKLLRRASEFEVTDERVSFEQFVAFDQMTRTKLQDIELAYKYFPSLRHKAWSKQEFQTLMQRIAGVNLTKGQVDLIFFVFDNNQDGCLDENEFFKEALQGRHSKGLKSTSEFSFGRIWECIKLE
ncbi:autophagy- protein 2 [Chytridiales sp. JEL 0842]|nr:autophagy- protein 2 [Chytridiales sp. JEL 0842]